MFPKIAEKVKNIKYFSRSRCFNYQRFITGFKVCFKIKFLNILRTFKLPLKKNLNNIFRCNLKKNLSVLVANFKNKTFFK